MTASQLVDALDQRGGLDFHSYAHASLFRRLHACMDDVGIASYGEYLAYLDDSPARYEQLCADVPVPCTWFFRDATLWERLRSQVLPDLTARIPATQPIRVWCAGCSTGEEAYSMAMLFAERLGLDHLRARVTIFATDVAKAPIAFARGGLYSLARTAILSSARRSTYLEARGRAERVSPELRGAITFSRHDLLRDPPLPRMDLVLCRNVLLYFSTSAQRRAYARLYLGLADEGVLATSAGDGAAQAAGLFHHVPGGLLQPNHGSRLAAIRQALVRSEDEPAPRRTPWRVPDADYVGHVPAAERDHFSL